MRILIVEDDEEIAEFLKRSLKEECFAVDRAKDGEEGSYFARTNEYDVIVLDNTLPKKLGIQVCQEVRAAGITTPIIILSVLRETTTKVGLLDAGADDYLNKPFSFNELLARIKALLRRPKLLLNNTLTIQDVVLDVHRHLVTRGGKDIPLTRKEFMLLEYLMRNAGMVRTRGMIREHVWDMDLDDLSSSIDTHILRIRHKLGDTDKLKPIIRTLRGQGYLICQE